MPSRARTHQPAQKHLHVQRVHLNAEDIRGTRHQRGYTNRWARYSKQRLQQHPWCVACIEEDGRYVLGQHTDHKVPPQGPEDPLFWDENNHQSMCHPHHSRKTAREDGGFGNPKHTRGRTNGKR